jgi:hypothetical protein
MKKLLLITIIGLVSFGLHAQRKMYIWPPKVENYVPTSILKGVCIKLEIKDLRIISPGSKVEATFEQISDAITKSITMTYGDDFINNESDTAVTIEVKMYDVQFYTGMWRSRIRYAVKINDNPEEIIEQSNQTFNTLGESNAKKILTTKCFTGTNMKLFEYLNSELSKTNKCPTLY